MRPDLRASRMRSGPLPIERMADEEQSLVEDCSIHPYLWKRKQFGTFSVRSASSF